jgi:hypothetical protein
MGSANPVVYYVLNAAIALAVQNAAQIDHILLQIKHVNV